MEGYSHENAEAVLQRLIHEPELFAVPELFLYEVFAVLHRHHPSAHTVFSEDVERLIRSGVLRYPMTEHVYTRAERFISMGLTGYDSVYVALAEELGGKWLTFDTKAHTILLGEDLSVDLSEQNHLQL
jgi:predicted nucleic acid-binding protein